MLAGIARSVALGFGPIGSSHPGPVGGHAALRCVSVRPAGRSDVYCLTVPGMEAFAVESGVIVHNCMDALRYAIMTGLEIAIVQPFDIAAPVFGRGDPNAGY